ncbi:response regulator transcription factor [Aneurinibacillus thermoaerophilus]|uniref:DNA-binding response regulator, OmpR family, contains REC and winged-helix (WHTH) domain n=1 Tax=Aneurinibacillus thermoaerophilus TaxID=143495 RepID=A0A1G7X7T7_ANETH|nr:response regulator transcription factor [Aneurinibacillus thermoaerophilus]MED0756976.1 response regulator transcription factor [Aneurinibacillus thermoaerophilus]MED0761719.1 response regulator transcription factor [Aneurinibacillus thermoaerophilus]SDG80225.1 DNA-binding response regulator, OmpR family, contains REC and winged-helix (wHTH) domain [Aneurinibacillus thermoaerophilus]
MYKVFIVEDEPKIAEMLAAHLEKYGYQPYVACNFKNLKQEFLEVRPHLVLLDINLPYFDGFYWCRQIRTVSNVPIVYVSARSGEMDQVMAIENGGDDYLTKPFHLDVVLAKLKSLLRRTYGEYAYSVSSSDILDLSGLVLDRSRFTAEFRDRSIHLSKTEFQLLEGLARKAGQAVSRETLLETLWDDTTFVDDNTLTVNVTRLRKKLEELGLGDCIETIRRHGYKLNVQWADEQAAWMGGEEP